MPKVTIAIPTYNRREYLAECIKSILNQTFQDFEIIVFDNHSDYDIEEFVSKLGDKRIKLTINEKNLNHVGNFSKIFNYKFNSKYLVIFHDDDTMHPLLLEKEMRVLEANPDVVFVATGMRFVKNHRKMNDFIKTSEESPLRIFKETFSFIRLILSNFNLCYDSAMYRTNILKGVISDNDKFSKWADRPYLINLSKKGKVAVLKDKLVNYRIHKNQDSQAEPVGRAQYLFNLFLSYKENLPQPLSKKDKRLFYSFTTNNLILSGFSFSKDCKGYKKFLKQAKDKDIFKLRYLNFRGIYYFFKGIKKIVFPKNE